MDALPVTLIVKAPNQQFEDQTIKCESSWSIRKLKGYLSEVYPCNPTLEEQKLIYSGQLLNDAHILKDVLRQYEGQETHTVHLVYTPKNRQNQPTTKSTSRSDNKDTANQQNRQISQSQSQSAPQHRTDALNSHGIRQRNIGTENNERNNHQPIQPPFMTGYLNVSQPFMPEMVFAQPNQAQYTPEQYALAQQMSMQNMMHQMYIQYMNQYAAALQSNSNANVQQFPGNCFHFVNTNTANSQVNEEIPQPEPARRQPRFQPPADDDAENRDWIEILYTLSRFLVLLSLVYFYSSPGRCSIVIIFIVLYYFYQKHQRNRNRQQMDNDNGAGDDSGVVIIQPENEEPHGNDANEEHNIDDESVTLNASADASASTISGDQDDNRLPTVTLLRTFILSFFSSLIPETPAV